MATARVTWIDPVVRDDNTTPMTPAEIAEIDVFMSQDNGNTFTQVGKAAAGQQMFDQDVVAPGTYLFKLQTVDTQTPPLTSKASTVASVTVPAPELAPPGPPTQVAATLLTPPSKSGGASSKR